MKAHVRASIGVLLALYVVAPALARADEPPPVEYPPPPPPPPPPYYPVGTPPPAEWQPPPREVSSERVGGTLTLGPSYHNLAGLGFAGVSLAFGITHEWRHFAIGGEARLSAEAYDGRLPAIPFEIGFTAEYIPTPRLRLGLGGEFGVFTIQRVTVPFFFNDIALPYLGVHAQIAVDLWHREGPEALKGLFLMARASIEATSNDDGSGLSDLTWSIYVGPGLRF